MLALVKSDDQCGRGGDEILIHVRYLSNGDVMTIDSQPPQLSAQQWRDLLLTEAPECYQTFVGSRGFLRLPRQLYDAIVARVTPMAAE